MRALRILFTTAVLLLIVSAVGGLIAREILLAMGISQLRSAARELKAIQTDPEFVASCLEYGGPPHGDLSLTSTQLRFVSDNDFILEMVCQTSESLRSTLRTDTLPPLVEKGFGQSGLIEGRDLHGVTLTVLGRTGVVYEENSFVQSAISYSDSPHLQLESGPTTVCEGYGFQCCNETTQLGQEVQQTQALDCPLSCYASCIEKPVILNFNSDPPPETGTRLTYVQAGQTVVFYYTVNDIQGDVFARRASLDDENPLSFSEKLLVLLKNIFQVNPAQDVLDRIAINFGDGESAQLSDLQGTVAHTYTCLQTECVYNATIQAVTRAGTTSTLTDLSTLQLRVVPE